jgi:hypothetical protein
MRIFTGAFGMRLILLAVLLAISTSAQAKPNVRAMCLAQAGVTDAQWRNRQATFAQGAIVKDCMTKHGVNITVHRRDGSVLY